MSGSGSCRDDLDTWMDDLPDTPSEQPLPCLEYEWGCANYGNDRSRWCVNCQANANSKEQHQ